MTSPHWSRPPPSSPASPPRWNWPSTTCAAANRFRAPMKLHPELALRAKPAPLTRQWRKVDTEGELFGVVPGEVTCSSWPERTPGWVRAAFDFLHADDNVVQATRAAGLATGKTNTLEFGLPCHTEP